MQVVDNVAALREARAALGNVGLVPTMGALHAGHLSLVEHARNDNEHVIATIFVNPTQFGPHEDLAAYPRDLPGDLALLEQAGVSLVFTPTPDLMYPPGYQTYVMVEDVAQGLEGERRPGHFRGVATVVAKLFNLIQPQRAYFGQKDAQQVAVIRRMAHDLNFPLQIMVCPTVREPDGLAMSSRNQYLTQPQRAAASVLYRALQEAGRLYDAGQRHPDILRQAMRSALAGQPLVAQIDYVSVADARTLKEVESTGDAPLLLSLAVEIGRTHLIDNCLLPLALNTPEGLSAALGRP